MGGRLQIPILPGAHFILKRWAKRAKAPPTTWFEALRLSASHKTPATNQTRSPARRPRSYRRSAGCFGSRWAASMAIPRSRSLHPTGSSSTAWGWRPMCLGMHHRCRPAEIEGGRFALLPPPQAAIAQLTSSALHVGARRVLNIRLSVCVSGYIRILSRSRPSSVEAP